MTDNLDRALVISGLARNLRPDSDLRDALHRGESMAQLWGSANHRVLVWLLEWCRIPFNSLQRPLGEDGEPLSIQDSPWWTEEEWAAYLRWEVEQATYLRAQFDGCPPAVEALFTGDSLRRLLACQFTPARGFHAEGFCRA